MSNKHTPKKPLRKDVLLEALNANNTSIRKLDLDHNFVWSASTINRALRLGASEALLNDLGKRLNVDPDYLSGKYHSQIEKINDKNTRKALFNSLNVHKFPYIKKLQRDKIDGDFIYSKMIDYMLISHNISTSQFDEMTIDDKRAFQIEMENAIVKVLLNHFKLDCIGNELYPEIYKTLNDIENYYSDEPSDYNL